MPKVTAQYLDDRRNQILDAARTCFARNGFHATSMQDLFTESGLSAGAVYRYFPSKAEMVLAIAEENMRDVVATVRDAAEATDPARPQDAQSIGDVLARIYELIAARNADTGLAGMAVVVWGEGLRDPALGEGLAALLDETRRSFAVAVATQQRLGRVTDAVPPEAVAAVAVATVPGFLLQLALGGPEAVAGFGPAARALWP
ncbi:TetR/AcrR family transcriptional regulator [uncultured Jatrophihabitans sp.]|uniref:TetR/AcrR family transcriptional regulator n=1 Tax=uncultured Jatrophihabitans sp. TaxID=1610747 RepID=UPI0035CB885D